MERIERIKLYHYPATRSARVKWLLHEVLGNDFDVELVRLYEAEQYAPAFTQHNPNHAVPVLDLTLSDGRHMHMVESGAMVALLADAFPEQGLAPEPGLTAARADYLQMLHLGTTCLDAMLWQVRAHEHVLPPDIRDGRTAQRYRDKFAQEGEPQLSARLESAPFICGSSFTAADCVIAHDVMWARVYGMCQAPVFADYIGRMATRPAFLSAFSDAQEFTPEPPEGAPIFAHFTG